MRRPTKDFVANALHLALLNFVTDHCCSFVVLAQHMLYGANVSIEVLVMLGDTQSDGGRVSLLALF